MSARRFDPPPRLALALAKLNEQREQARARRRSRLLHRIADRPLNIAALVVLARAMRRENGGRLDADDLKLRAGRLGLTYWTPGGPDAIGIALWRSERS